MATRITGSAPPRTRGDREPRGDPRPVRPAPRMPAPRVPVPPGAVPPRPVPPRAAPPRGASPARGTRSQPARPPARTVTPPGRPGLKAVLALGAEAPPRARTAAPPKTAPRAAPPKIAPPKIAPPTGPVPRTTPRAATGAARPETADVGGARRRMPFLLLIVGMLCGALVCLLVISTTLAAGSFRITSLRQQDQALAKQQQQLQQQVAQDQAPSVIAQRAGQLGMRPVTQLEFLNVKTGKISSDAATGADAQIQVPGYTP
jgi:hypothetical protein